MPMHFDLFLSYSSIDRERIRVVYTALRTKGFRVFWSDDIPPGSPNWNSAISEALTNSALVLVFWSSHSVTSGPVRQEFEQAAEDGKLIQIVIDPLKPMQFPMHKAYSDQRLHLFDWGGNAEDPAWKKLMSELEARLMPAWVRHRESELCAQVDIEVMARQGAEVRLRAVSARLQEELDKEKAISNALDAEKAECGRLAGLLERANERVKNGLATAEVTGEALEAATDMLRRCEEERDALKRELSSRQHAAASFEALFDLSRGSTGVNIHIEKDETINQRIATVGQVVIDGTVNADIACSIAIVNEPGVVNGNIKALGVVQKGKVSGKILGERILLTSTSSTEGDIYHQALAIAQGAYFEGKSRRGSVRLLDRLDKLSSSRSFVRDSNLSWVFEGLAGAKADPKKE